MTTALVVFGFAAYFGGATLFLSRGLRRIDADFRRDMARVLRSRTPGGSTNPQTVGSPSRRLGFTAGVETRPASPLSPPAPALVGAARPRDAAPTRPPQVRIGGAL